MAKEENYTPVVWKLVSLIILVAGVLIGFILLVSDQPLFAFLFIFIGIVGFLPLLAISQVFQLILSPPHQGGEQQAASQAENINQHVKDVWTLSNTEKEAIIKHYEAQDQVIDDILVSPVPNYVAVIVGGNLDIVKLNGSEVLLLNKMDVEAIPELYNWIEDDFLDSKS